MLRDCWEFEQFLLGAICIGSNVNDLAVEQLTLAGERAGFEEASAMLFANRLDDFVARV